MRWAVLASGIHKPVTCLSIRHSFATHLLECGQSIRTSQELMGYSDLNTTMTYIHVLKLSSMGVISPRTICSGRNTLIPGPICTVRNEHLSLRSIAPWFQRTLCSDWISDRW